MGVPIHNIVKFFEFWCWKLSSWTSHNQVVQTGKLSKSIAGRNLLQSFPPLRSRCTPLKDVLYAIVAKSGSRHRKCQTIPLKKICTGEVHVVAGCMETKLTGRTMVTKPFQMKRGLVHGFKTRGFRFWGRRWCMLICKDWMVEWLYSQLLFKKPNRRKLMAQPR